MSAIKVTYKNTVYTLEFSRKTAAMIEQKGFRPSEVTTCPNIMIPLLVQGAFLKNHAKLTQTKIDEIYKEIKHKDEFVAKLIELYAEPTNTLFEDNEEGNATWEMA